MIELQTVFDSRLVGPSFLVSLKAEDVLVILVCEQDFWKMCTILSFL